MIVEVRRVRFKSSWRKHLTHPIRCAKRAGGRCGARARHATELPERLQHVKASEQTEV